MKTTYDLWVKCNSFVMENYFGSEISAFTIQKIYDDINKLDENERLMFILVLMSYLNPRRL